MTSKKITLDSQNESDYIKLESLLKYVGLVSTGGQAKVFIQNGEVTVNGEVCTQRGKKLRAGDKIKLFDDEIEIG